MSWLGLLWCLSSTESACNVRVTRDVSSVPRLERLPGRGHGSPSQYSSLEKPMDRGAWHAIVHRITKSQTRLKQLGTHNIHA